jgi:hypothetical protein
VFRGEVKQYTDIEVVRLIGRMLTKVGGQLEEHA